MYPEHYLITEMVQLMNERGSLRDNEFWGLSVEFQGSTFGFRVTTVSD